MNAAKLSRILALLTAACLFGTVGNLLAAPKPTFAHWSLRIVLLAVGRLTAMVTTIGIVCSVLRVRRVPAKLLRVAAVVFSVVGIFQVLQGKLQTLTAMQRAGEALTYTQYRDGLQTEALLAAELTGDAFPSWYLKTHWYGMPSPSASSTRESGVLLLYAKPAAGYASVTAFDPGVSGTAPLQGLPAALADLASVYLVSDGMNECGLAAALLPDGETAAPEPEKPVLSPLYAVRAVLDRCADVPEALAFLGRYALSAENGQSFRLLLQDRAGNIAAYPAGTDDANTVRSDKSLFDPGRGRIFDLAALTLESGSFRFELPVTRK
ncbi:MAG: hypothetical protein Q4C53_02700 [Clostridia bacterium]|nr:hypothetical protein [Clostridia bacterium]